MMKYNLNKFNLFYFFITVIYSVMTQNVFCFFYQLAETFWSLKTGSVRALPQKNIYTDLQQVAKAQSTAEEKYLHNTHHCREPK